MSVPQSQDKPLLGQKDTLQQNGLAFQLGNPDGVVGHLGHQIRIDRVRVQMSPETGVHPHQRMGHQGVVGDVAVALVVRRTGPGMLPVGVVGADDAGDRTTPTVLDLLVRPPFGGPAEGIPHGATGKGGDGAIFELVHAL